jgi:predicted nucleic acid-binding protein
MPENAYHGAAARLLQGEERLAVLDLTLYEVANVVARKYRQPEDARKLSQLILRRCHGQAVRIDVGLIDDIVDLVAEHDLTAYDAAYVAAARRNGWQLVSADIRDLVSKGLAVAPDAADYP